MTSRQRVACAFDCSPSDKVPIYQAGFCADVASRILGRDAHVGGGHAQYLEAKALWEGEAAHERYLRRCWEDPVELCRLLDLDVVRTTYWRMPEKPTLRINERTFMYGDEEGDWRVMRYEPQTELYQVVASSDRQEPTMGQLERSVAAREEAIADYEPNPDMFAPTLRTMEEFGEEGVPYGGGGIGLAIPREEVWLRAVAQRPDIVERYLNVQAERACRNARLGGRLGVKYLYGGGDFASPSGPFISPASFHRLMLPALEKISDACERAGARHGFASDGNLWPVAEDLFEGSGVDFFYEVDEAAGMDFERLRRTFPHLTLMGGINSATLHRGTKQQVMDETMRALDVAKEYGGCIVGCSNQIVKGTPLENFWTMMRTLHESR